MLRKVGWWREVILISSRKGGELDRTDAFETNISVNFKTYLRSTMSKQYFISGETSGCTD